MPFLAGEGRCGISNVGIACRYERQVRLKQQVAHLLNSSLKWVEMGMLVPLRGGWCYLWSLCSMNTTLVQ
jgi:hypothetical protein